MLKTGWELDYVRDMDVLTFNSVTAIVTKLVYRDKAEDAWVRMIAAQGEKKAMDQLTKAWMTAVGERVKAPDPKTAPTGAAAFLKALKMGSSGGRF